MLKLKIMFVIIFNFNIIYVKMPNFCFKYRKYSMNKYTYMRRMCHRNQDRHYKINGIHPVSVAIYR